MAATGSKAGTGPGGSEEKLPNAEGTGRGVGGAEAPCLRVLARAGATKVGASGRSAVSAGSCVSPGVTEP